MDDFVYGIRCFIQSESLIKPGEKVLAGISGGADSTALLLVLNELKENLAFELEAVHVEHGIRGKESLDDEAFVRRLCDELGIRLWSERISVPQRREESGETLEEAARNARYEIFEQIRVRSGADRIALAHHAGDQTETVLWNLCRGTGLSGLAGMSPQRGRIIRPFLNVERCRIEQWLVSRGQNWRTDSTNLETDQTRNRIRLEVLPLLESRINASSARHIREAADIARQAAQHLEREIDELEKELVREAPAPSRKLMISCADLTQLDEALSFGLIRRMIRRLRGDTGLKDLSKRHFDSVMALARKGGGKRIDLPGELAAVRERDDLCLLLWEDDSMPADDALSVPVSLEGGCVPFGRWKISFFGVRREELRCLKEAGIPEKKYTKWLACDTINHVTKLRTRQPGDYLVINAGGQKKALADYMIDEKIPARERDHIPLIAQGSHVLWVIGYRISYGARVTEETESALCISAEENGRQQEEVHM